VTQIKIEGTLSNSADMALDELRNKLYGKPGMRLMVIAELATTERTEPAPDETGKKQVVKLGIKHLEAAHTAETDELLRGAIAALKLSRTAQGTFDEESDAFQLNKDTLAAVGDNLAYRELARLRAAMEWQADRLYRLYTGTFTDKKRVDEIRKLHKIVKAELDWDEVPEGQGNLLRDSAGVVTG
jgi:hypothetical protein